MRIELFKHIYFRLPVFVRLLATILVIMVLFGTIIHYIEPKQFPTIFSGVWWAFVTAGTVGYGDFVPVTTAGRMVGIILILTGAGILTFYISIFAAATVKHEKKLSKGKIPFKGNEHIIIVGWNERARNLIEFMQRVHPQQDIVLIDRTLAYLSYKKYPVHFIHGDVTDDKILADANIQQANRVVITADHNQKQADHFTILATLAIKGNNHTIPIIAEILTKKQVENATRAGATTIIRPNDFIGSLLYHEVFNNEQNRSFEAILALLHQQQFCLVSIPETLDKHSFSACMLHYKETYNLLVIGIMRDGDWKINPFSDDLLYKEDKLIAIASWKKDQEPTLPG